MQDLVGNIEVMDHYADLVKKEIEKAGIQKWDLYLLDDRVNGIYIRKTAIDDRTNYHNLIYYIRVFQDINASHMGCGAVDLNSFDPVHIQKALHLATTVAKFNIQPKYDLIAPGKLYSNPKTYDKVVWQDIESFLMFKGDEICVHLREVLAAIPTFARFNVFRRQKVLLNSEGFHRSKLSSNFSYEFAFKAEKNERMAEYWPSGYVKEVNELRFEDRIPEWASLARDAVIAHPPPPDPSIDVLFAPRLVRQGFLATIGYAATARAIYENVSKFQINEQVAIPEFGLADDGLAEGCMGTSSWDSEGTPKRKTSLIHHGVMENYLFDQKFATLMHAESTGNAQRNPKRGGAINIEFNNLIIEPGMQSLRDIVRDTQKGILIIKFPWLRPNPITGDFGAFIDNAYMIENGEITTPMRGGTLSGNIYDMLKDIDAISSETRIVNNARVPYIKFKNLHLSSA